MSHLSMKVAYRPAESGCTHGRKPRRGILTLLLALCYSATALGLGVFALGAVLSVENFVSGSRPAPAVRAYAAPQGWRTETISQNRLGAEYARQQANVARRLSFH